MEPRRSHAPSVRAELQREAQAAGRVSRIDFPHGIAFRSSPVLSHHLGYLTRHKGSTGTGQAYRQVWQNPTLITYHEGDVWYDFSTFIDNLSATEGYDLAVSPLWPTGTSLTSSVALEELRIAVHYLKQLVTTLTEILHTLPKTGNLSRIVLDVDGDFQEAVDVAKWASLDAVLSEHAEKTSAIHPDRRLALQFRVDKEGATGDYDGWARDLVGSLALFPTVGDIEYVPRWR